MVVNPWGLVVAQAPDGVANALAEIDLHSVRQTRTRFPALDHVRDDLFNF
jgi:predicted amidohydrolase